MVVAVILPIIMAILGIIGGNKWLVLLGTIGTLYLLGAFVSLPTYIWIIIIGIVFLWIINQGKGK